MFRTLLCIGAGSFAGGIARYLVSKAVENSIPSSFPFGTMTVNIIGCLLIGLLYGTLERCDLLDSNWQLFLIVGFCGGFTTFSTFINENYTLFSQANFAHFFFYPICSFGLGLLALYAGRIAIKLI